MPFYWTYDGKIDHAALSGQVIRGGSKISHMIFIIMHILQREKVLEWNILMEMEKVSLFN